MGEDVATSSPCIILSVKQIQTVNLNCFVLFYIQAQQWMFREKI